MQHSLVKYCIPHIEIQCFNLVDIPLIECNFQPSLLSMVLHGDVSHLKVKGLHFIHILASATSAANAALNRTACHFSLIDGFILFNCPYWAQQRWLSEWNEEVFTSLKELWSSCCVLTATYNCNRSKCEYLRQIVFQPWPNGFHLAHTVLDNMELKRYLQVLLHSRMCWAAIFLTSSYSLTKKGCVLHYLPQFTEWMCCLWTARSRSLCCTALTSFHI